MRKIVTTVLSAALAATLTLTGCGPLAPNDAKSLLTEVSKVTNTDNYHFVGDITLDTTSGNAVTLNAECDAAGKSSHGTYKGSVVGVAFTGESYVTAAEGSDALTSYDSLLVLNYPVWTKSTVAYVTPIDCLTKLPALDQATFAASDNTYTLTIPGDVFYEGLMEAVPVLSSTKQFTNQATKEALSKTVATYTYGSDYKLKNINCKATFNSDNAQSKADLTVNFDVTNYGGIDEKKLAVPDDVAQNAIDPSKIQSGLAEIGASITSVIDEISNSQLNLDTVANDFGTYLNNLSSQILGGQGTAGTTGETTDTSANTTSNSGSSSQTSTAAENEEDKDAAAEDATDAGAKSATTDETK